MKPSGIQVNKPVLAFIVVVVVAIVWYLTSGSAKPEAISADDSAKNKAQSAQLSAQESKDTEKAGTVTLPDMAGTLELKPVPEADLSKVKVEENPVKVKVTSGTTEIEVKYRQVVPPSGSVSKHDVLLLHGASFSSKTWEDLKTLQLFGALSYRMVAIDLPETADKSNFMVNVIKALGLNKPVVVSPSASGKFSLPLLINGEDKIGGFVSLAPIETDKFKKEQYLQVKVPCLIVYGEKDERLGRQSYENLKNIPNSQTYVMKDGGHAAYVKNPGEFHKYLYNFLESIKA